MIDISLGRKKDSFRQLTCQNVMENLKNADETDIFEQRILPTVHSTPWDTHPHIAEFEWRQVLLSLYYASRPTNNRISSM